MSNKKINETTTNILNKLQENFQYKKTKYDHLPQSELDDEFDRSVHGFHEKQGKSSEEDIENCDKRMGTLEIESKQSVSTNGSTALRDALMAWGSLALAIISSSSIGPMFKYMTAHHIQSTQAAAWRCTCMCIFLVPVAAMELKLTKPEKRTSWTKIYPGLDYPLIVYVIWAGVLWALNLLLWIIGLNFTTTVRASIYSSLYPLLMVIYLYFFRGNKVSLLEWIGVFVSVVGIFVSAYKGLVQIMHGESTQELYAFFGDFLAFMAAFAQVAVIMNRHSIKDHIPLFQYTLVTTAVVAVIASIGSVIFELGTDRIFCMDDNCLFGWASNKWLIFMMLFGLYVGLICIAGFNYAMQYISPLVFSSVSLLDPAVTGLLSWGAGIEPIPRIEIWIGGFITLFGIGMVTFGEHFREEEDDSPSVPKVNDAETGESGDFTEKEMELMKHLAEKEKQLIEQFESLQ